MAANSIVGKVLSLPKISYFTIAYVNSSLTSEYWAKCGLTSSNSIILCLILGYMACQFALPLPS